MEKKIFEITRAIPIYSDMMVKNYNYSNNITDVLTFINELIKVGYIITPNSFKIIMTYPIDIKYLYNIIKDYIGDVLAKPMYPDFPKTVQNIDEDTYRLNQYMHYASTYGVEYIKEIFNIDGLNIKPYIPDSPDTEKTKDDDTLLTVKPIELLYAERSYYYNKTIIQLDNSVILYPEYVVKSILSKRERMSNSEEDIVRFIINRYELYDIKIGSYRIPFKENLIPLVEILMDDEISYATNKAIYKICDHSGDLFKCIMSYIKKNKWKLRTSQKKAFCKALDRFDAFDFSENLIISNKHREKVLDILKVIDFTRYSRDDKKKEYVVALRNKELRSWYSKLEENIRKNNKTKVLEMLSKRPTELLRRLNRLIRLDYDPVKLNDIIINSLIPIHTLINVFNFFSYKIKEIKDRYDELCYIKGEHAGLYESHYTGIKNEMEIYKDICIICINSMYYQFKNMKDCIPFANKRVFIDSSIERLKGSYIIPNNSEESGYIRSGISYEIPDNCKILRFFCYWNDSKNGYIDIDLHAYAIDNNNTIHIGWNGSYNDNGIYTSGDCTRSDSAEYIDVDLANTTTKKILIYLDIYDGARSFKDIETVFTGAMAVNKTNSDVKLYNSKNCFWYNNLNSNNRALSYAVIDIDNRCITFIGKKYTHISDTKKIFNELYSSMTLYSYILSMCRAVDATISENKDEADYVIVLDKEQASNEISLIENNFFLDNE